MPRSAEDLKRKRRNSEVWNGLNRGQLGRSLDILAPYIISELHLKDHFSAVKHPKCDFGENIENYYRYCMSHDLFLTHALGDPQVDRSTLMSAMPLTPARKAELPYFPGCAKSRPSRELPDTAQSARIQIKPETWLSMRVIEQT